MNDFVYFDGDPSTDSARRRMERVLKGEEPPPRWPWMVAALGGGGLWLIWRWARAARAANPSEPETGATAAGTTRGEHRR